MPVIHQSWERNGLANVGAVVRRTVPATEPLRRGRKQVAMFVLRLGLVPFDLLLRLIGPKYRLFYWFFLTAPPGLVGWLGRPARDPRRR